MKEIKAIELGMMLECLLPEEVEILQSRFTEEELEQLKIKLTSVDAEGITDEDVFNILETKIRNFMKD